MNELESKKILITGGAGFIGCNIVTELVKLKCKHITILDNLDTGYFSNIDSFVNSGQVTFIKGDIRNYQDCFEVTKNCDIILHQAALGSVPRSIEKPINTHDVNVTGFINILEAAKVNHVKRLVYASSSSVYGNDLSLPKVEDKVGNPLSPYAVSKKTNELYANVFAELYKMEIIGLRYFNVFGPFQNANGPYAAVIPIFINNILNEKDCTIFGDGSNRRDFTYIDNVVQANLLAATVTNPQALNQVYNIAYGATKTINDLFAEISSYMDSGKKAQYLAPRVGEIKDSFADIDKAKTLLGYHPKVDLSTGIKLTVDWYKSNKK